MKIKEKKKAVSLIVLVITVIVLSILAATVIVSISDTDVISETNKTVFKADMASYKEAFEMYVTSETMKNNSFDSSSLDGAYKDNVDTFNKIFGKVESKYQDGLKVQGGKLVYETEDETEKEIAKNLGMGAVEYISKTDSYAGYYVKVGNEYGIIFADLAKDKNTNKSWGSGSSAYRYSYTEVEASLLKDYAISEESYTSVFGTAPVLEAVESPSKQNRFYVMALSDITPGTKYCWYAATYVDSSHVTISNNYDSFGYREREFNGNVDGVEQRTVWRAGR